MYKLVTTIVLSGKEESFNVDSFSVTFRDSDNYGTGIKVENPTRNAYDQSYYLKSELLSDEDFPEGDDSKEDEIEEAFPGLMAEIFNEVYEHFDFDEENCVYVPKVLPPNKGILGNDLLVRYV